VYIEPVARANVDFRGTVPWTERVYETAPIAPFWLGVGVAVGLLLVFLALTWVSGELAAFLSSNVGLWESRDVRIAFLVASMAGYLPTARRYVALGAEKNLEDLRPLLDSTSQGYEAIRRRFGRLDVRAARTAGTLGILIAPLSALAFDRDPALYFQRAYWGPENSFEWVVGACVGWCLGHFVYATLGYARRFSDLADQVERIDLLELRALAPFARQGLRSALLWLVLLSLISLNAQDLAWFAATAVIALVGGTAGLILPVRGIHRRLRQTKQAELQRVHAAIRGDLEPLSESCIAGRASTATLSDLLAYREYVESVREWPFDSPTLLRFSLYLAIPLGSWLGGAFVERLLGVALD
jgi:hypothetical protein